MPCLSLPWPSALAVRRSLLTGMLVLLASAGSAAEPTVPPDHAEQMKQGLKLFREQIRSVLTQHCLDCHGGQTTKADFNVATRESLMASGMVGEDAESSHLYAVVAHREEPHMPHDADKLPDEVLAAIARWLDLGAPYDGPLVALPAEPAADSGPSEAERGFWSFQPLDTISPPSVRDSSWVRTPIDRFILARLEREGLQPNPLTDRRRLIRRAYFDLLGLPPTPEEIAAFVKDPDPQAYEKLIDRLLESPHYGERWARHWMDIARFAESHGYEQDYDRPNAYPYRDFLIQALNTDLPYDQFVRWQIAGDELARDNALALTATGFLGGGAFPTQLTEAEFESARYDELDDMVSTLGTAVLGLSVGCARCHDHKFDPISSLDYYRLASVFTTTIRSEVPLDLAPDANRQRKEAYEQRLAELRAAVERHEREVLSGQLAEWLKTEESASPPRDKWQVVEVESAASSAGTSHVRQPDGSYLATGAAAAQDVLTIVATVPALPVAAVRLEALADPSLPQHGPGRAANGNFVLSHIAVVLDSPEGQSRELSLRAARATHQQDDGTLAVKASLDPDPATGWAVDGGGIGKNQAAVFELADEVTPEAGQQLRITLAFNHPNAQHTLGRWRLAVSSESNVDPWTPGVSPDIAAAIEQLRTRPDPASAPWQRVLPWFAARDSEWQRLRAAVAEFETAGPGLEMTTVQVTSEGLPHMKHNADDRGFPHFYPQTYVLTRGDVHQKNEVAEPGYLSVLVSPGYEAEHWSVVPPQSGAGTSYRRAALANWITDTQHGAGALAARVMVNRLWHHHFGRGIVATPSDFGFQGERPTHPELLDWLAVDFVHHGWQLKRMHKLIMTSAVYMQSGAFDEERASIDRENVLWWRRAPRRLEAEPIRDAMLHVAGLLDTRMFGPGSLDESMPRRSIYFFIKRSQLIPTMMLFDWPEHLVGIGQRATTTIAPQALLFMNSSTARQCAEALARRLAMEAADEAIARAYQLALGRDPTAEEVKLAAAFLEQQQERYVAELKVDDPKAAHAAAWTDLCQTLFCMNEFIYID